MSNRELYLIGVIVIVLGLGIGGSVTGWLHKTKPPVPTHTVFDLQPGVDRLVDGLTAAENMEVAAPNKITSVTVDKNGNPWAHVTIKVRRTDLGLDTIATFHLKMLFQNGWYPSHAEPDYPKKAPGA